MSPLASLLNAEAMGVQIVLFLPFIMLYAQNN
jgi:hypothetical protein